MRGSVASCGSPVPKSINCTPSAGSRRFASSRRTNGYVPSWARTGDRRTALDAPRAQEPLQRLERALQRPDLDALVARVGVAGGARAEVHGVHSARGEVGDVGPCLFRLDAEVAGPPEALGERRARGDAACPRGRDGPPPRGGLVQAGPPPPVGARAAAARTETVP